MKLMRLLLCLAVDASETSDEIQGKFFGEIEIVLLAAFVGRGFSVDNHDHVHTTQQVPITHATAASSYNYQTCLDMVSGQYLLIICWAFYRVVFGTTWLTIPIARCQQQRRQKRRLQLRLQHPIMVLFRIWNRLD